jgi:hypothetical protein
MKECEAMPARPRTRYDCPGPGPIAEQCRRPARFIDSVFHKAWCEQHVKIVTDQGVKVKRIVLDKDFKL